MKVCPTCGNAEFITTGIQRHDWVVDGDGQFVIDLGCYDAKLGGGGWECRKCGDEFVGPEALKEE